MSVGLALSKSLEAALKSSEVVTPESDNYEQSLRRYAASAEKRAGIVVFPKSAEDVSTVVLFSQKHNLDLAVCGGGHSTSGASSTDGGIVIDLSKMRNVSVSPENMTITAQGGCVWEDVDKAAAQHGLATVGGTVNHTGIGGLTLGGGYGWLSGKYGLAIDNLLSVEMVLANGRIVTASEKEHSNLFWAARGAGQNFGVATKFEYRAYPKKDPVWAGLLIFSTDDLEPVVEFANKLVDVSEGESAMAVVLSAPAPLGGAPAVIAAVFYDGPKEAGEEVFAPITRDLKPLVNSVAEIPYQALNGMLNGAAIFGGRKATKGSSFVTPLNPSHVRDILNEYTQFINAVPGGPGSAVILEFFNMSKICAVSNTATAFANRGNYQNIGVAAKWDNAEDDDFCRKFARRVAGMVKDERIRQIGDQIEGVAEYGNYDGLGASAQEIFGSNYERLVELKTIYDPDNVFHKSFKIIPTTRN
ncbi:MAG: hypothetical protein M1837_007003 [Sclerophora amabilis]|nr:MAG: hypothetical protein M1837_007003 [Sclerophora amabilis]